MLNDVFSDLKLSDVTSVSVRTVSLQSLTSKNTCEAFSECPLVSWHHLTSRKSSQLVPTK